MNAIIVICDMQSYLRRLSFILTGYGSPLNTSLGTSGCDFVRRKRRAASDFQTNKVFHIGPCCPYSELAVSQREVCGEAERTDVRLDAAPIRSLKTRATQLQLSADIRTVTTSNQNTICQGFVTCQSLGTPKILAASVLSKVRVASGLQSEQVISRPQRRKCD